jgi:hypothetical protein
VENAIKINAKDADMIIMEQTSERKKHMKDVKSVFERADADGSGRLDATELQKHIDDVRVQAYLRQLDLDVEGHESFALFELLDFDGSGTIDIDEFIFGCERLKGMARSLDLFRIEHGQRALCRQVTNICQVIYELRSQMGYKAVDQFLVPSTPGSTSAIFTTSNVPDKPMTAPNSMPSPKIVPFNDGASEKGKQSTWVNKQSLPIGADEFTAIVPGSLPMREEANDSSAQDNVMC